MQYKLKLVATISTNMIIKANDKNEAEELAAEKFKEFYNIDIEDYYATDFEEA